MLIACMCTCSTSQPVSSSSRCCGSMSSASAAGMAKAAPSNTSTPVNHPPKRALDLACTSRLTTGTLQSCKGHAELTIACIAGFHRTLNDVELLAERRTYTLFATIHVENADVSWQKEFTRTLNLGDTRSQLPHQSPPLPQCPNPTSSIRCKGAPSLRPSKPPGPNAGWAQS